MAASNDCTPSPRSFDKHRHTGASGHDDACLDACAHAGGRIAVTFSAPLSHRTIQIKGVCSTAAVATEDAATAARQSEAFAAILSAIGYSPPFVTAICDYRSSDMRALEVSIDAAFEQTPGPGAGRPL